MRASFMALAASAVLLAASLGPALAQAGSTKPTCPVAGIYQVSGKSPGQSGAAYSGRATIVSKNGLCEVRWRTPTEIVGSGAYANGVLTVSFDMTGGEGLAVYTRGANGALDGVWWSKAAPAAKGSETLTPDPNRAT